MSERIDNLINNIREKSILMNEKLSIYEKGKENLENQIKALKNDLNSLMLKNEGFREQIVSLQQDVQARNEQSISKSDETGVSDEKIDELVKEIEFCIGQIKK